MSKVLGIDLGTRLRSFGATDGQATNSLINVI